MRFRPRPRLTKDALWLYGEGDMWRPTRLWSNYQRAWRHTHEDPTEPLGSHASSELVWVTNTAAWDTKWFRRQGFRLPRYVVTPKEYGE